MVRGSSSDSDVIKVFQESLKHIAEKVIYKKSTKTYTDTTDRQTAGLK